MDYQTQLHELKIYKKQYREILNKIENYSEKIDWLNSQANELECLIFQHERELRMYH